MVRRMAGPERVSATALAKEVGISQGTLSRWLRDARTVPAMGGNRKRPVDLTSVCSRIDVTAEAVSFLRRDRAQPSTAAA